MADQLRRIATGGQSLLSFSTHNPLITFMSNGVPRINDIKLDSKLELDSDLTKTCEAFIMHVTKMVVEPMLSFITKVTAVRVSSAPLTKVANEGGAPATPAKKIKDQAFATAARQGAQKEFPTGPELLAAFAELPPAGEVQER